MLNPLDHPICFTVPGRMCASAWLEHGPFAMYLIDVLRPSTLVELGTHHGYSYCAFCQAIQTLNAGTSSFAVDSWNGDQHAGSYGPEIFEELSGYHDRLYGDFSNLLRTSFDEALGQFADGSIDLLHTDGFHSYEAVRHDFESWLPKMSRRGVVLFHDTNVRERNFGVWRFWSEVKQRYKSFEFVHGHGLGMLGVGEELPVAIDALLDANRDNVAKLRRFFSHLGKSLSARYFVEKLGQDLNQAHSRERGHEARAGELQAQLLRRGEEADALTARVADRQWHVDSLAAMVAERDARVGALTSTVGEREAEVESLTARLHEAVAESAALGARVADREWHVESLAAMVADRDGRVATLTSQAADHDGQVARRDSSIAALVDQLAGHDRCLAELASQLLEKDQWIVRLEADNSGRHEALTRMHGEAIAAHELSEERHREILGLRDHLRSIEESLTWRAASSARDAIRALNPARLRPRNRLRLAFGSLAGLRRTGFNLIACRTTQGLQIVRRKWTRTDRPTSQFVPPPRVSVVGRDIADDPSDGHRPTPEPYSRNPEGPMSFQGRKRR